MERGIMFAHRSIVEHEVLQRVMQTEPEKLLPALTVESIRIRQGIAEFLVPYLGNGAWRPGVDLDEAADFLARMVLSYMSAPGRWDLDDPVQVAQLVRAELLAGVVARRRGGDADRGPDRAGPAAVVDNETKSDLTFQRGRSGGRTPCGRATRLTDAGRRPRRSAGRSAGQAVSPPGPDHRRHAGLPGPTRHRQDDRGRHRPTGRLVEGHGLPGVPRGPGRGAGRGGRHGDGPALLGPRGVPGRGRGPRRCPGRGHRRGVDPDPRARRPRLSGRARARDGARAPGLRRVRSPAGHRLPVHRPVPGPVDEPDGGRAGGRVGHPHRALLRHRAVGAHGHHRPGPGPPPGGDLRAPGDPGPARRRRGRGHRHHPVRPHRRPTRTATTDDRHSGSGPIRPSSSRGSTP